MTMTAIEIPQLDPGQAWERIKSDGDTVLLDVRSKVEFDYVGHPIDAINVPWQEAPEWRVDPGFVEKVRARLAAARPGRKPEELVVLALCRSGTRSLVAAEALAQAGFQSVFNIDEGFEGTRDACKHRSTINGWRFRELPWEQT